MAHQLDIFTRFVADGTGTRRQKSLQDFMARNWFALSKKRKRTLLEHKFGKDQFIRITSDRGIATVWDYDFLLFAMTQLRDQIDRGAQLDGSLTFTVSDYALFCDESLRNRRGRKRSVLSGRFYRNFWSMLERLHHTHVETNVRADGYTFTQKFSWLYSIAKKERDKKILEVRVQIADWFVHRVREERQMLAFDQRYFTLTGALERWLFLFARKSAGRRSWTESLHSIYEKSASEEKFSDWKLRVQRILKKRNNRLLNYEVTMNNDDSLTIQFMKDVAVVAKNADGSNTIDLQT